MEINEQVLLERAEEVQRKADIYKNLIFAHEIFKHKSKAYLASLKISFVSKCSDAAQETSALATLEWTKFLDVEMETLKAAGRAKIELEAAMVRYESMRSALSSRKNEIKSFG